MNSGLSASPAATTPSGKLAFYASVGAVLTQYDVDVAGLALTRKGSVTLPAGVQYVWPHASGRYLYVTSSNSAPGSGPEGTVHHLSAFRIDAQTGELIPHGNAIPLPVRPIHMTTDIPSTHVLVAYNRPSMLRVYRINADGTLGDEVKQSESLDFGIYGHQARVTPDNRLALFVARGNNPAPGKPEDPGSLEVFRYQDGVLSAQTSIAPNGGYGFGPRHLDFHPVQPWVYVSLERESKMQLYRIVGDTLSAEPLYSKPILANPDKIISRQAAGTVHVHPSGRFLYGVNRADTPELVEGRKVFIGGENSLTVYAIDETTGEPVPIQHVETRGIHCRTFHIDPSGRMLVAAHNKPVLVRDGAGVRSVPACLSVFRIGDDGKLDFVRKYDVEVGDKMMFWTGMVAY